MSNKNYKSKLLLSAIMATCCFTSVTAYKIHHVVSGESMWGISNKYKITIDQLMEANPSLVNGLKADTDIRIPEPGDLKNPAGNAAASPETDKGKTADAPSTPGNNVSHVVRIDRSKRNSQSAPEPEPAASENHVVRKGDDNSGHQPIQSKTDAGDRFVTVAESSAAYTAQGDMANTPDNANRIPTPPRIPVSAPPGQSGGLYTAGFSETFSSISGLTGVPVDSLVRLNPFVDGNMIEEGTILRLTSSPAVQPDGRNLTFVDSMEMHMFEQPAVRKVQGETTAVVIALPFDADATTLSKQSLLATEFYKGMLLAFNSSLASKDTPSVKIIAVDTKDGVEKAASQIESFNLGAGSIIIPSDDDALLAALSRGSGSPTVLNVLSIRDNSYVSNPNIIQCNISQPLMYAKAVWYVTDQLGDYTPVILNPSSGASEKSGFTDLLCNSYRDKGIEVIELNFTNKLTDKDLARLSKNKKYVFIPKSGNQEVFEKFAGALSTYFQDDTEYDRLKLFGYPDWIMYTGDNEKALHDMHAQIYSRFYIDEQDYFTKEVQDEYARWYGAPMAKAFPVQAMLGYDAANLILHAQGQRWAGSAADRFDGVSYEGEQSAFHLIHDQSKGLVNDALYIIKYLPGGSCIIDVI